MLCKTKCFVLSENPCAHLRKKQQQPCQSFFMLGAEVEHTTTHLYHVFAQFAVDHMVSWQQLATKTEHTQGLWHLADLLQTPWVQVSYSLYTLGCRQF
jgi:hypothetical protein